MNQPTIQCDTCNTTFTAGNNCSLVHHWELVFLILSLLFLFQTRFTVFLNPCSLAITIYTITAQHVHKVALRNTSVTTWAGWQSFILLSIILSADKRLLTWTNLMQRNDTSTFDGRMTFVHSLMTIGIIWFLARRVWQGYFTIHASWLISTPNLGSPTWHNTIASVLSTHGTIFKSGYEIFHQSGNVFLYSSRYFWLIIR